MSILFSQSLEFLQRCLVNGRGISVVWSRILLKIKIFATSNVYWHSDHSKIRVQTCIGVFIGLPYLSRCCKPYGISFNVILAAVPLITFLKVLPLSAQVRNDLNKALFWTGLTNIWHNKNKMIKTKKQDNTKGAHYCFFKNRKDIN